MTSIFTDATNKPSAPINIQFRNAKSKSVTLCWNQEQSWPPIIGFKLVVREVIEGHETEIVNKDLSGDTRMYALPFLSTQKSYMFSIAAKNSIGRGPFGICEIFYILLVETFNMY